MILKFNFDYINQSKNCDTSQKIIIKKPYYDYKIKIRKIPKTTELKLK